jgi:hypothetical protein
LTSQNNQQSQRTTVGAGESRKYNFKGNALPQIAQDESNRNHYGFPEALL